MRFTRTIYCRVYSRIYFDLLCKDNTNFLTTVTHSGNVKRRNFAFFSIKIKVDSESSKRDYPYNMAYKYDVYC